MTNNCLWFSSEATLMLSKSLQFCKWHKIWFSLRSATDPQNHFAECQEVAIGYETLPFKSIGIFSWSSTTIKARGGWGGKTFSNQTALKAILSFEFIIYSTSLITTQCVHGFQPTAPMRRIQSPVLEEGFTLVTVLLWLDYLQPVHRMSDLRVCMTRPQQRKHASVKG